MDSRHRASDTRVHPLQAKGRVRMPPPKSPSWSDVKAQLTQFDRAGLIGLVHDLYAASKANQTFLQARFALGEDVLKPYKASIQRWLWPAAFTNQNYSVAKAKKAIADYRKAAGQPQELAELTVFYCERAAGFCNDIGLQDEGYFAALERMFAQALEAIAKLPAGQHAALLQRLDHVRRISHSVGYGVGDELDALLLQHTRINP